MLKITYIHTYIPLALHPQRGSRGISDIKDYRIKYHQVYDLLTRLYACERYEVEAIPY
jgi:hypothetical protein